ncbi:alpha/beta hydrolase [Prosthecomicrobium sp. N25]|uniref:alpha/beta hydrolase n=1 Tax=Prosthecomicrobium sp. N25 TaxID=3129254 RepID=UPI003076B164
MLVSTRRVVLATLIAAAAALTGPAALAQSMKGMGVVLIHGKAGGQGPLQPLAAALRADGALVALPNMSWTSGYRTYDETLDEIARSVEGLRRQGVTRIVLAGHSLGANVALGYAARRRGVAAVVAMAPGHRPQNFLTRIGADIGRARAMVAAGQGQQTAIFTDFNQGKALTVRTTAVAYLSFFDPAGPGNMANTAGKAGVPILWVIGTGDEAALRDPVPTGTGTRILVGANHGDTPSVAVAEIMGWLRGR